MRWRSYAESIATKKRLKEVKKAIDVIVQAQLTSVAIVLLAHLGVSHAGYQTLINATSWVRGEDNKNSVCRVPCSLDTATYR